MIAPLPDPPIPLPRARWFKPTLICFVAIFFVLAGGVGCATIRVTDPPRTASEEFLLTGAAQRAVDQLTVDALRDRLVWIETGYLISTTQPFDRSFLVGEVRQPSFEQIFLIAAVRAKLLASGVRLATRREQAQIILEIRSGGLSIDRTEFLLGIPATAIPYSSSSTVGAVAVATPELSILKSTKQHGFASVAYVAYWADTGELLTVSGPFVGRTVREDYWILGTGPRTIGNVPPAQER